jgi:hypothetical protein
LAVAEDGKDALGGLLGDVAAEEGCGFGGGGVKDDRRRVFFHKLLRV